MTAMAKRRPMRIATIVSDSNMEPIPESGTISEAIIEAGGEMSLIHRRHNDPLPASDEGFDGLVILGAEIGVNDAVWVDYFTRLGVLFRRFHAAGKPVFGSCLGAQLVAKALGGTVFRLPVMEYGFVPLRLTESATTDELLGGLEATQILFEAHQDSFTLPPGAVALIAGETVPNQGFRVGATTYALQCHFEADAETIRLWTRRLKTGARHYFNGLPSDVIERLEGDLERYIDGQLAFGRTISRRWVGLVRKGMEADSPQSGNRS